MAPTVGVVFGQSILFTIIKISNLMLENLIFLIYEKKKFISYAL